MLFTVHQPVHAKALQIPSLKKLGVEAINVSDFNADVVAENDNLILGTSTWGAGELQDDWYDGINVLKGADLSGKTVAIFGCGDAESYSDTFCGAMKEIYDAAQGANILPGVSTDGYTFDDSEAVVDGKFVGLALDDVNEDDRQRNVSTLGWKLLSQHCKLYQEIVLTL